MAFLDSSTPPGGEPEPSGPAGGLLDNLALTVSAPLPAARLVPPPSSVPRFQPRLHDHDGEHQRQRGAVPATATCRSCTACWPRAPRWPTTTRCTTRATRTTWPSRAATPTPRAPSTGRTSRTRTRTSGDELQARAMSWMAYEQGMGYRCNDRASTEFRYDKYYYPDDAPFINYTDVSASRARCKAHLVDTRTAQTGFAAAPVPRRCSPGSRRTTTTTASRRATGTCRAGRCRTAGCGGPSRRSWTRRPGGPRSRC